jgi:hypothetical protein
MWTELLMKRLSAKNIIFEDGKLKIAAVKKEDR